MTPVVLDQIGNDDDGIVDRFQWIGCMLLKLATILRCSELMVSSRIQGLKDKKDVEDSLRLLKVEKLALEEANQKITSKLAELKEVTRLKDQWLEEKDCQLEKSASRVSELKEANKKAFDEISKMKAGIKFIDGQQEKSTYEIKDNILVKCQVICPEADFSEVGLNNHIKDGCIEIALSKRKEMRKIHLSLQSE